MTMYLIHSWGVTDCRTALSRPSVARPVCS